MGALLVLVLLLVSVDRSECVRCFARFNLITGECEDEIGEVAQDDCCQNPGYGFQTADGASRFCGPPVWSSWSSWSQCNVLCGDGVRVKKRTCFGISSESQCTKPTDNLQMEPCAGICCKTEGWGLWQNWSPCSVSCGAGGIRRRQRVCANSPECQSACTGPSEETETCPVLNTCPVHGGWSSWSGWSDCSGSCINDQRNDVPSRRRYRSCSNPAPSNTTVPPGDSCPGENVQEQNCSELPNCPVDGNWGAWSPPSPCSVTCGKGLQMSTRMCNNPVPKYGGRVCEGMSAETRICESPCPVDGFWSGWSNWGDCSFLCIRPDAFPTRTRQRSCSNPAPSIHLGGKRCEGDGHQVENCGHLPHCPVDGLWSSWSPFTSCPVTCGVGLVVSVRTCDSPAPKHGGQPCPGETRRTRICTTSVHCPVDGVWSEWSPWTTCLYPAGGRDIRCHHKWGIQSREHWCEHRAHNGSICSGPLMDRRVCYNVDKCPLKGTWEGWLPWSSCKPLCGANSKRSREKFCKPDYSGYSIIVGRQKEEATFSGKPQADCGSVPFKDRFEIQVCHNVPPCP